MDTTDIVKRLYDAILDGNLDIVRQIVSEGFDLNTTFDSRGDSALDHAVRAEQPEIVEYLLDAGADYKINEQNLLVEAAWCPRILELLVSRGAGVGGRVYINEVFILGCQDHAEDKESLSKVIEIYLCLGANINYRDACNKYSALHYAAFWRDRDLADVLLNGFAMASNPVGMDHAVSALCMALEKDSRDDVAKIIIESGINLDPSDRDYDAPLHVAVQCLRQETEHRMVELLLKHGANVNAVTRGGFTALAFKALKPGLCRPTSIPTMQLLLEYGADPKVEVTFRGKTKPLMDIVLQNEGDYIRPEIVKFFQELAAQKSLRSLRDG